MKVILTKKQDCMVLKKYRKIKNKPFDKNIFSSASIQRIKNITNEITEITEIIF